MPIWTGKASSWNSNGDDKLLNLQDVGKRLPSGVEILHAATLEVLPGEVVAVLGPSGAGKSTLLSLAGLLDRPTSGAVILDGRRVDTLRGAAMSRTRLNDLGFLFQSVHLLLGMSAFENVSMGLRYQALATRDRSARVIEALEKVGLRDLAHRRSADLSGGERQRVALARAIVRRPSVLFCDEPTGSLDPSNGSRIIDLLLEQANEGRAVLVVTHSEALATRASRTISLCEGRLA